MVSSFESSFANLCGPERDGTAEGLSFASDLSLFLFGSLPSCGPLMWQVDYSDDI